MFAAQSEVQIDFVKEVLMGIAMGQEFSKFN